MWCVIKFKKNNLTNLKFDLSKKLGSEPQFYLPKIKYNYYKRNKFSQKEMSLLEDYALCFHEKFRNSKIVESLKFSKGLKYFLNNSYFSQIELINFINRCKKHEDKEGFLKNSFFDYIKGNTYKFIAGPFSQKLFKIVELNKNKIQVLIGNLKTTVSKKNNYFKTV